jgi:hypothetical protein
MREDEAMTKRARIAAFGSAGVLVIAGVVCAAVISGATGQVLALVLIGIGLVAATSLVFLEVGLSEDRERDREATSRNGALGRRKGARSSLRRSRGHRRRLR